MDTVTKLLRDRAEPRTVLLRIPMALLSQAQIEPWSEVVLRAEAGRIVIEAVHQDTDLMEMHAEEFVAAYTSVLRRLEDSCPQTG